MNLKWTHSMDIRLPSDLFIPVQPQQTFPSLVSYRVVSGQWLDSRMAGRRLVVSRLD